MTLPSPLAIIDVRSKFGFDRTVCSCAECVKPCRYMPGYLIPADLDRIHKHLAPERDLLTWARAHLLASPGALVTVRGRRLSSASWRRTWWLLAGLME
jgi:hypothetical protein